MPTRRARQQPGNWLAGAGAACCLAVLAVLVAGCGTSGTPTATPAEVHAMAARYLAIARPANRLLDKEIDGYGDHEWDDLARAQADLRAEAATERRFDAQLLAIRFPSQIALTARSLVRVNQHRIELTERQARAGSLPRMRSFDRQHKAADAALEAQVRMIRVDLGLPPPSTS
jgi:hypothetical protein